MKRIISIISAAALVLLAGSCIQEQLTTFDATEADAPVLQSNVTLLPNATNPKSVVLYYTPAVFHRTFNTKMDGYHSAALISVDGKPVDRNLGAAFDPEAGTVTISLSALNKILMGLGLAEGAQPTIQVVLRASIQPTVYESSVLSYVQSADAATISGFTVTAPAGSPYPEYTLSSNWSVTGALSAYGIDWNDDLEMWSTPDGDKFVAKAVRLKEGDKFKFRKDQAWTDNYGGVFGALDAEFSAEAGGADIEIGAEGVYDLWLDTEAKTITVTEAYLPYPDYKDASTWSVIGHLNAYSMDWDGDITMLTDGSSYIAMNVIVSDGDKFKFRKDKAWTDNFGGVFGALDAEFEAVAGGADIEVPAGAYDMFLDPEAKTIRIVESLGAGVSGIIAKEEGGGEDEPEEVILDETWAVIGAVNGTSWDKDFYMTESDGVWTSPVLSFAEGAAFKLRFDNTWFYDDCIVGGPEADHDASTGETFIGLQPGFDIKMNTPGDYYITFKESTLEITAHSMANHYSLIGNVNGSSWNKDFYMTESDGIWTSDEVTIAGEFKIRFDAKWDENYGVANGEETPLGTAFTPTSGEANFNVPEGQYTVVFDPAKKEVTIIPSKPADKWSVIGYVNGSTWDEDFYMKEVIPGLWVSDVLDITGGWKVRFNNSWDVNRGAAVKEGAGTLSEAGQFVAAYPGGEDLSLTGKFAVVYNANNGTVGTLGWGVVGHIASIDGFDWNADIPMNLAADGKWYSVPVTFSEGDEFKLRWMAEWGQDFGGNLAEIDKPFEKGGDNVKVSSAGTYMVVYDPEASTITLSTDFWGLVGEFNSWGGDRFMLPLGDGKWTAYNQEISGGWKIRKSAAWTVSAGGTYAAAGEAFDGVTADGPDINVDMTRFDVLYDTAAGKITVSAPVK